MFAVQDMRLKERNLYKKAKFLVDWFGKPSLGYSIRPFPIIPRFGKFRANNLFVQVKDGEYGEPWDPLWYQELLLKYNNEIVLRCLETGSRGIEVQKYLSGEWEQELDNLYSHYYDLRPSFMFYSKKLPVGP